LGERLDRTQEVVGSSPTSSITEVSLRLVCAPGVFTLSSMKALLLPVALGIASLALATMALGADGLESPECPKKEPPQARHPALLTITALHMFNQPVRTQCADLARGPIWDLGRPGRPGDGLTMVIDAHDVTPVPGYGAHGPFYRLYTIKPGDLAKIKWKACGGPTDSLLTRSPSHNASRTGTSTTSPSRAGRARWCTSMLLAPVHA
jgi:hypothetical protein